MGIAGPGFTEGGFDFRAEREPAANGGFTQGKIEGSRVDSGFVPNIFGFGMRRNVTPWTTVTAYFAVWHAIQTEARRKFYENFPDVREGYIKLEGLWGSLLVGRALTLFSRGATEIDFLYGHGFGVGSPANYDSRGPSAGHVGFGVLANGFASGIAYATPMVAGLQLTVGYYDPVTADGVFWERTKLGQPEAELTFDRGLGARGKVHLFANGGFQKLYEVNGTRDTSAYGVGYGGRVEFGIFRLGLAGHWGKGVGLNYAFQFNNTAVDTVHPAHEFRVFDGLYAQGQVRLRKVDFSAGGGITQVHELVADVTPDPTTGRLPVSVLKQQVGLSAGVFYHFTDYLHFGIDYFLADVKWWQGERQTLQALHSGLTVTW
jgi:hypothetical protein